jgi:acylphosphatase
MERGVLTFKTEYSDSDFKIEWDGIKEIYTVSYLLITLSDGSRYNGYINTLPDGNVEITIEGGETRTVKHDDIVWLDDIDVGFWSKLYASIDVGFDIAKSNNLRQISTRASLGYLAEQWNFDVSYNTLFSKQDNIENIERTDGSINYKYFLPKSWYPYISINFLSNTEQSIDLRSSGSIGFGKYIIHTNRSYWGVNLGANFNNERFTIDTIPNRDSWEGSIGNRVKSVLISVYWICLPK